MEVAADYSAREEHHGAAACGLPLRELVGPAGLAKAPGYNWYAAFECGFDAGFRFEGIQDPDPGYHYPNPADDEAYLKAYAFGTELRLKKEEHMKQRARVGA